MADPKRKSLELPWILRERVHFFMPQFYDVAGWRSFVRAQPFMMDCREVITSRILALPWQIVTREPTEKNRRKDEIKAITYMFESMGGNGYEVEVEKVLQDALDTTVGGAFEVLKYETGRKAGDLFDLFHMDAASLYPTGSIDVPLLQYNPYDQTQSPTQFTKDQCTRYMYTPRPEIQRLGWCMPPPEKIYTAANVLVSGDRYYIDLLSDTPEAGILDLLDMSQASAEEWVESFRSLMLGTNAFKIPVLYDHEKAAQWIPFTRSPQEITYNETTMRYAALVAAGYGLKLTDVGLVAERGGSGGGSSAITSSRSTRKTGIGNAVAKLTRMFSRVLPDHLKFMLDYVDEEELVSRGRARVASFTALNTAVTAGWMDPEEARAQIVEDGLITITLNDKFVPNVQLKGSAGVVGSTNQNLPEMRKDPSTSASDRRVEPGTGGQPLLNQVQKSLTLTLDEQFPKETIDYVDSYRDAEADTNPDDHFAFQLEI